MRPYISLFQEKILGNKATVYHRTNVNDLIKEIYTSGFKPGDGDFYGKGFYSTFDLGSQLKHSMKDSYGDIIVKFIITSLYNFFIYEWDEFIKTSVYVRIKNYFKNEKITKGNFVVKQFEFYFDRKKVSENIIKDLEEYNKKLSLKKIYSSEIALYLYKKLNPNIYKSNIDGIIFEGRTDGKVLVCYNTDLLKPIEYTNDEGVTWKKVNDIDREIIDRYNKKVLDNTLSSFYKNIKTISPFESESSWFFHIIRKYKIPKENYEIISFGSKSPTMIFVWKKGIWDYSEPWKKGTWEYGTWKSGIWKKGTWCDGIWKYGTWEDGIWYDGIWEDGMWKYGIWEDGTWVNGIWENGTWKDGVWEGGIWENGIWKKGWIYDPDKKGNYEPNWQWEDEYVLSPINPKEYFKQRITY